jgi:ankyrin repeat protein
MIRLKRVLTDVRLLLFNILQMFIRAERELQTIIDGISGRIPAFKFNQGLFKLLEGPRSVIVQMQVIVIDMANESPQLTRHLSGSILISALAAQGLSNFGLPHDSLAVRLNGEGCKICRSSNFTSKSKLAEQLRCNQDVIGELFVREDMWNINRGFNRCIGCDADLAHLWYQIAQLRVDIIKQGKAILGGLQLLSKLPITFQKCPIFLRDGFVKVQTQEGRSAQFIDCLGRTRLHRFIDRSTKLSAFHEMNIQHQLSEMYQKGDQLLDVQDMLGRTILHQACQYGYNNVAKDLLELGVDSKKKTVWDMIPLHHAVENCSERVCQLLVEAWPQSAQDRDLAGFTPLHHAVIGMNSRTLGIMLNNNIGLNIVDENGDTPLMMAVCKGHKEIVKLLSECMDVDLEFENNDGESALTLAEYWDRDEILTLLKQEIDRRHSEE